MNPRDVDAFFGLGLAFQKMGRLDKAIEALQTAYSLTPNDPDLLREMGIVHFLSGRLDPSIEMLEALRSAGNNNLSGIYYLGKGYQEKGRFDQALSLYLKVREGMPEFPDVYYYIGSVYGRMGRKGLSHFYFGKNFIEGKEECSPPFQDGSGVAGEGKYREERGRTGNQRTDPDQMTVLRKVGIIPSFQFRFV
jgi:tetratricopeptide (TPR) repeat protein